MIADETDPGNSSEEDDKNPKGKVKNCKKRGKRVVDVKNKLPKVPPKK